MSNILANKSAVNEVEQDFTGSYNVLDSNVYEAKIKLAYFTKSRSSKAAAVNLVFDIDGTDRKFTIWVLSSEGEITYTNKKTGKKQNTQGYNLVNSICNITLSMNLQDLETEKKTVKIYDYNENKDVPQEVDCLYELHGSKLYVAIQKQEVDKTTLNENTGKYEPTGETREVNELVKGFFFDNIVTVSEVAKYITDLGGSYENELNNGKLNVAVSRMDDATENDNSFYSVWLNKNEGQVYVKAKGKGKSSSNKRISSSSNSSSSSNKSEDTGGNSLFD